jgi:hypothetical protein
MKQFARGVRGGILTTAMPSAAKTLIERGRVLVVTIADQEPKHAGPLVEVHDEVTGLLNHPNTVRVRGDAEQMYAAVATSITIST